MGCVWGASDDYCGIVCGVSENGGAGMTSDYTFQREDGKWGYYDETQSDSGDGPFETQAEAREALRKYAHWLDTGEKIV
jgi:hypothetical protein